MPRPRVYNVQPARRHYLFSERKNVYELTFDLQEKLKKELAAIPAAELLNRSSQEVAAEIIGRYTLQTPKLDRNDIAELPAKETQIQVPHSPRTGPSLAPARSTRRSYQVWAGSHARHSGPKLLR